MVTFKNLSAFDGVPPLEGENRKIAGGPLYSLTEIQTLTEQPGCVQFWTSKCRRDAANLSLSPADVGGMIRELKARDYRDSEWCDNGKGFWAACDAYSLARNEYLENVGKWFRMEYFLKFAKNKTGELVLIVSCHTSA